MGSKGTFLTTNKDFRWPIPDLTFWEVFSSIESLAFSQNDIFIQAVLQ
jgi:hypothetical protein